MASKTVTFRISRTMTNNKKMPNHDEFEIPVQRWTTVLDGLLYAKSYLDSSKA